MNNSRNTLLQKVLKDDTIRQMVNQNKLSLEEVDKDLNVLLAYMLKKEKCHHCQSLSQCTQNSRGYQPEINYNGIHFELNYVPCAYQQIRQNEQLKENHLILLSCSFQMFNFDQIYINEKRKKVLASIKTCISKYEQNEPVKGIFLHGTYGCGKTYLLAYLAKRFSEAGHQVIFAYYPDLVRSIKSAIGSGDLENFIEELKHVEILILDDFGGETSSSFIRDEVLGAILQERMTKKSLTFMSSNLDAALLLEHLKEGSKDVDVLKAARIYERIRTLMEFIELNDQNYRD